MIWEAMVLGDRVSDECWNRFIEIVHTDVLAGSVLGGVRLEGVRLSRPS